MFETNQTPDSLLTCFRQEQLPIYQKAVETWHDKCLEINRNGVVIKTDYALHITCSRKDMGPFWRHFEKVKQRYMRGK